MPYSAGRAEVPDLVVKIEVLHLFESLVKMRSYLVGECDHVYPVETSDQILVEKVFVVLGLVRQVHLQPHIVKILKLITLYIYIC